MSMAEACPTRTGPVASRTCEVGRVSRHNVWRKCVPPSDAGGLGGYGRGWVNKPCSVSTRTSVLGQPLELQAGVGRPRQRLLAQPPGGLVVHLPQGRTRRPVMRRTSRDRTPRPLATCHSTPELGPGYGEDPHHQLACGGVDTCTSNAQSSVRVMPFNVSALTVWVVDMLAAPRRWRAPRRPIF
jgi:hypothetical protein